MSEGNGQIRLAAVELRAGDADARSIRNETRIDAHEKRLDVTEGLWRKVLLASLAGSLGGGAVAAAVIKAFV